MTDPILARFNGHCPTCETKIIAGEEAVVCVGGVWFHEDCAPAEAEEAA